MRLDFSAISDVGRVRKDNQDSGLRRPAPGRRLRRRRRRGPRRHRLEHRDRPAAQARGATRPAPDTSESDLLGLVSGALHRAHDRIAELVDENPSLNGTSTTATIALFDGDRVGMGHVGDSRAYLFRDGEISQLTNDHTFVQTLIDEGRITEEEARVHPHRNLILRAIDGIHDLEPDLFVLELEAGDRLLLCSDGASGVLDAGRLADILSSGSPDYAAVELVRASLEAGSSDNVTCLVADVVDGSAGRARATPRPLLVGAAADMRARRTARQDRAKVDQPVPRPPRRRHRRARADPRRDPRRGRRSRSRATRSRTPRPLRYAPARTRPLHLAEPAARARRRRRRGLGDRRGRVVVEPGPVLRRRAGRHRRDLPRPRRLAARASTCPSPTRPPTSTSTGSPTSRRRTSARASTPAASPTPATTVESLAEKMSPAEAEAGRGRLMSQAGFVMGFVHRRRRGAELFLLVLALAVGIGAYAAVGIGVEGEVPPDIIGYGAVAGRAGDRRPRRGPAGGAVRRPGAAPGRHRAQRPRASR